MKMQISFRIDQNDTVFQRFDFFQMEETGCFQTVFLFGTGDAAPECAFFRFEYAVELLVRLNIGCPRAQLERALEAMKNVLG